MFENSRRCDDTFQSRRNLRNRHAYGTALAAIQGFRREELGMAVRAQFVHEAKRMLRDGGTAARRQEMVEVVS
jgi:hypothetical protein